MKKYLFLLCISIPIITTAAERNRTVCATQLTPLQPSAAITVSAKEHLEHQQHMRWLKISATTFSILGYGAYSYYLLQQKNRQQKRFISDAIAATNMTTSLFQGAAGCVAGAYAYYKIRSWLYDGYMKEVEFKKQISLLENRFHARDNDLAKAINDHATAIDQLTKNSTTPDLNIVELLRVAQAHADDLNETKKDIFRLDRVQQNHALAINTTEKIIENLRKEGREVAQRLHDMLENITKIDREKEETQSQSVALLQTTHELKESAWALQQELKKIKTIPDTPIVHVQEATALQSESQKSSATPQVIPSAPKSPFPKSVTVAMQKVDKDTKTGCGC